MRLPTLPQPNLSFPQLDDLIVCILETVIATADLEGMRSVRGCGLNDDVDDLLGLLRGVDSGEGTWGFEEWEEGVFGSVWCVCHCIYSEWDFQRRVFQLRGI